MRAMTNDGTEQAVTGGRGEAAEKEAEDLFSWCNLTADLSVQSQN